jgi:hypothetical protein
MKFKMTNSFKVAASENDLPSPSNFDPFFPNHDVLAKILVPSPIYTGWSEIEICTQKLKMPGFFFYEFLKF